MLTFNSLQTPLNIVGTSTPPAPTAPSGAWGVQNAYNGGLSVPRYAAAGDYWSVKMDCRFDVALTAGVEYAAYLPWSRGCGYNDNQGGAPCMYAVLEGAYRRVGRISSMFGASGG
ncbi:hypothetical protein D3C73_1465170 [compost metagenome]